MVVEISIYFVKCCGDRYLNAIEWEALGIFFFNKLLVVTEISINPSSYPIDEILYIQSTVVFGYKNVYMRSQL